MIIPKLTKWQIIEIHWVDSMHSSGWLIDTDAEGKSDDYLNHKTIGYYFDKGAKAITVVQSYGEEFKDKSRNTDARMSIPICAITKIRKI